MRFRVELTERAVRDLAAIYDFILARHVGRAAAWFEGLERRIADLAEYPERGAPVPEQPGLRQVIHIRHGGRIRAQL